jgi:hypothetical protein
MVPMDATIHSICIVFGECETDGMNPNESKTKEHSDVSGRMLQKEPSILVLHKSEATRDCYAGDNR